MPISRHHHLHRLHLVALSGLAVAQPLYDLIGRHATFLVAHGAGAGTILALILALSLGVPLVLIGIVELMRLAGPRAAGWTQAVCVGLLAGLLAAIAARTLAAPLALGIAATAAVGAAAAYRFSAVRLFLTILSPAAVLFPALFVLTTPAGRLLWPDALTSGPDGFAHRPPIVVVVFDEMTTFTLLGQDGAIDAARFPNLAGFADTATWFPNAVAAHPFTADALPAILTGVHVEASPDLLPIAADHPLNLFTWLANAYELRVSEPITRLCPQALCPQGSRFATTAFTHDIAVLYLHLVVPNAIATQRLPTLGLAWAGFGGATTADVDRDHDLHAAFWDVSRRGRPNAFRDFLGAIAGPPRPVLYFLHALLPHDPYRRFASGTAYAAPGLTDGMAATGVWIDDPWVVEAGRDRHIEQERFADALLGEFLTKLKSQGLFDEALIVVTSDHGSAFGPGGQHRWLTESNYQEVATIPLLVKRPGQTEGDVSTRPASGLDVVPTIAAALGAELPWPVDGAPLFDDDFPARDTFSYAGQTLPRFDVRAEAARRAAAPRADARYRPLLDRRLADLPLAPPRDGVRVFSDNFFAFEDVRPESGFVPALVRGYVEGHVRGEPLVLAVAVNGVVHGITRTYEWEGRAHAFAVLLPEASLHEGANHLEAFVVDALPSGFRLTPLATDVTSGIEIESSDGAEFLLTRSDRTDGRWMPRPAHLGSIMSAAMPEPRKIPTEADTPAAPHGLSVTPAALPDVLILEPRVFVDNRGHFYESFNQQAFAAATGRLDRFVQDNHSLSHRHVLRGLHYQLERPQGKLVRVVAGEIFDVAVDLRRSSPTLGRWVAVRLSAGNRRQLWVPEGFGHGFLVLSASAEVVYKATDYYDPAAERTLRWNDPSLAIEWPEAETVRLSEKDAAGTPFDAADLFP